MVGLKRMELACRLLLQRSRFVTSLWHFWKKADAKMPFLEDPNVSVTIGCVKKSGFGTAPSFDGAWIW